MQFENAIIYLNQITNSLNQKVNEEIELKLYNKLALCLNEVGQFELAKKYAEKAKIIIELKPGSDKREKFRTYVNLGNCYKNSAVYKTSLKYFEKAIAIAKHTNKIQNYHLAQIYLEKSNVSLRLREFNEAKIHLSQANLLSIENTERGILQKVDIISTEGTLNFLQNNYKEALEFYYKSLKITSSINPKKTERIAKLNCQLGLTYYQLEDLDRSLKLLLESMEGYKLIEKDESPEVINNCFHIANIYSKNGQFNKALTWNKKTLDLTKKIYGNEHPRVGMSYAMIAMTYSSILDYENELSYFKKALEIFRNKLGEKHEWTATTYENIGRAYQYLGNLSLSKKNLDKAIELRIALRGPAHEQLAHNYTVAAETYSKMGFNTRAINMHKMAIKILRNKYPLKHVKVMKAYNQAGRLHVEVGNFKYGLTFFDTIINNYSTEVEDKNFGTVLGEREKLRQVIKAYLGRGKGLQKEYDNLGSLEKLVASNQSFKMADSLVSRVRNSIYTSNDRMKYRTINQEPIFGLVQTFASLRMKNNHAKYVEEAFYYSEKNKAGLLTDFYNSNYKITDQFGLRKLKEIENLEQQISEVRTKIKTDTLDGYDYLSNLINLYDSLDSVTADFKKKDLNQFIFQNREDFLSIKEIQSKLDSKTTLLEYFVKDSITFVFTVSKYELDLKRIDTPLLEEEIKSMNASIINKDIDKFRSHSNLIYNKIFKPIEHKIKGNKIIVIPDGPIWQLNFDLLLTSDEDSNNPKKWPYLLKTYVVSYANSANLLLNYLNFNTAANRKCLAFSYMDSSSFMAPNKGTLETLRKYKSDLPGSREEIQKISNLVKGNYYFGTQADEGTFKKYAQDYGILHLSLHGEVDINEPDYSRLVFTKTKDSLEDGFLYAHEILLLKLQNELTVLSACETGTGKIEEGEGMMSLGNAFQFAGAKSLLLTRWKIPDQIAPEIMELFYINLANGLDKPTALQQAKLRFLEQSDAFNSHPFYWSSYYLIGDTSPLKFESQLSTSLLLISVLLVVIITIIFFLKRNKYKIIKS